MSTVLVVDDTQTDLQIAALTLQKMGYEVVTATSEAEAKTRMAAKKPDLIVLDVVLPDRSGFEFCRDLKDDAQTKQIPVVMCSSKNSKADIFWGKHQGADAYLTKPVSPEELGSTVKGLM